MPEEMSQEEIHEIRMRNMRAVNDVINQTGLEEEYLGASNGIAGAKRPLPPEERQYPEHDKLIEHIMDLVGGNIEGGRDCMHAREMLDDILVDLTYLKNAIGTPEQYHEKGLL
jgi:hypothetical protein|tara:strand:- start:285 stop:623 length:339 start_codon:yes stop_codon:yes gene_type:complete